MSYILSIVVTVYNTEPYLRRCLDSCLNQIGVSSEDFEVLIVNDGSPDNSATIIDEYISQHANVRCVNQDNQGLSMARNNGLKASEGQYVWFVDSDDWISSESVRLIIDSAGNKPDVIPIKAINDGCNRDRNVIPSDAKDGKDVLLRGKWLFCGPFYVYKKSFWEENNFSYYPGIYHEDAELTPRVLYAAKKVCVIDKVLYYVYQTPGSITRKPKEKQSYDFLLVAEHLNDFAQHHVKEHELKKQLFYHASVLLNSGMSKMRHFDKKAQHKYNEHLYQHRKVFSCLWKSPLKYKIENILFCIFPKHYMGIYKLMKKF